MVMEVQTCNVRLIKNCRIQETICLDIFININVFAAQTRSPCQQLAQENVKCEMIIEGENNPFIVADPAAHSRGPGSLKVGRRPV